MIKLKKEQKEVLSLALATYGEEKQLRQLQEECAELIAEINRVSRKERQDKISFLLELADVIILILQILPTVNESELQQSVDFKIERLQKRLKTEAVNYRNRFSSIKINGEEIISIDK